MSLMSEVLRYLVTVTPVIESMNKRTKLDARAKFLTYD